MMRHTLLIILSFLSVSVAPGNKDDHGDRQVGACRLMSNESLSLYDTIQVSSVTPDTLRPLNFLSDTFQKTEKAAAAVRSIFFIKGDSPG